MSKEGEGDKQLNPRLCDSEVPAENSRNVIRSCQDHAIALVLKADY